MIAFTVLGECVSSKNSREIVKMGARWALVKSKEAQAYEQAASLQIPPAARQMLRGPVRVTMRIFYVNERKDLDGALLLDVMQAKYSRMPGKLTKVGDGRFVEGKGERVLIRRGVYENDRQARELHFYHSIDRANPRAEILIEPLEPQQAALPVPTPAAQAEAERDADIPFG